MDATPAFVRLQTGSPIREPAWRWRRAQHLATRRRLRTRHDDPETVAIVRHLRALGRCRSERQRLRVQEQWPALDAARRLSVEEGPRRWEVEARLLAGQSDAEVAACAALDQEAVRWYELAFFSVRDRLHATDWVLGKVLGPGFFEGYAENEPGRLWQAFAFTGGARALELVLAVTRRRPLPAWAGAPGSFREARLRLSVKLSVLALRAEPGVPWRALHHVHEQRRRLEGAVRGERDKSLALLGPMCAVLDLARPGQQQAAAKRSGQGIAVPAEGNRPLFRSGGEGTVAAAGHDTPAGR